MKDITNQRFGKLIAIEPHHQDKYNSWWWLCKCDCGGEKVVKGSNLIRKDTKSCGCLYKTSKITHGFSKSKLYLIYQRAYRGCYIPQDKLYYLLGAKGIKMVEEWLDITNFIAWACSTKYKEGLFLARIDKEGPFSPDNCKWVDSEEMNNTKANNHYLTYNNKTLTLAQWELETKIPAATLATRLTRGWTEERALITPVHKYDSPFSNAQDPSKEDTVRLKRIFYQIKRRCYCEKDASYLRYGGRGITICEEWLEDSSSFFSWAFAHHYASNLTIDRIDNDGNYCPENCRWATHKENNNNRNNCRYITYKGVTLTLSGWAREINLSKKIIKWRLDNGWTIERTLTTPKQK
jgi:hypothetical protein